MKASEFNFKISNISLWLTFLFLVSAIITKRENIVLFALLLIIPIFRAVNKKPPAPRGYFILLFISVLTVSFFSNYINIFSIESNEGADIGTKTFSLTFLFQNLEQSLLAFTNFKYWGLTGILFLLSLLIIIVKKSYSQLGVLFLTISLLYIFLYASHYRSYYQVHYNIMFPFETLRYSVTYLPLIAIFISSINFKELFPGLKIYKRSISICIFFLSLFLVFNSIKTRIDFSNDEYFSRISPVVKTLEVVKESDIIITDLPIVFHCYVSDKQHVIDFYSLSAEKLSNLIFDNPKSNVYLIKRKDNPADAQRYNSNIDIQQYCFNLINLEIENYELIKFCNNATKN